MPRLSEDFLLKQDPKSPFWYYRLQGEKTFKSTKQRTKAAAKKVALNAWKEKSTPKEKYKSISFGQFAGNFFDWDSIWCMRQFAKGRLQSSTALWRKGLLKNQILPFFQNREISSITPNQIDVWLMSLQVTDRTKEHSRTTMRIIFREAMRERVIQQNPMEYIERLNVISVPNEPPLMEELKRLFPSDKNQFRKIWPLTHYGVMCSITATSGLRMQEVRALTPKSIIVEKQGIIVAQAVKCTGEIGLPKSDEVRVVLVPQSSIELISWWIRVMNIHHPDQLLFPGRSGGPIDRKAPYKYFRQALNIAKIDSSGRKLTVHGLRHAYNTRMREILTEAAIEGFWDETQMCFANKLKSADQILREYTGHRSVQMTDLYDHPDLLKKIDAFQVFKIYSERFWD